MTETTMLEHVARAICIRRGGDPDTEITYQNGSPSVLLWQDYEDDARAAIEAMRTPTDEMLDAINAHAGSIAPEYAWESGIDAALSEQQP